MSEWQKERRMNALYKRILVTTQQNQGIYSGTLAVLLQVTPSRLSYHIKKAEGKKEMFTFWDNGQKRLFVPSGRWLE